MPFLALENIVKSGGAGRLTTMGIGMCTPLHAYTRCTLTHTHTRKHACINNSHGVLMTSVLYYFHIWREKLAPVAEPICLKLPRPHHHNEGESITPSLHPTSSRSPAHSVHRSHVFARIFPEHTQTLWTASSLARHQQGCV